MEDRFLVIPKFHQNWDLCAVFDGHGGDYVAKFCANNLSRTLVKCINENNGNIRKALHACFKALDEGMPLDESYMTGSTCLVVLSDPSSNKMWVANAGDSRGIMNKHNRHVVLARDHKPNLPSEKERIEESGGFIKHIGVWRVQGDLAVSRAIGDKRYRPYVICDPEVKCVEVKKDLNKFVVLATDGLWDVVKNAEVNQVVLQANGNASRACELLMQTAIDNSYEDNITIMVGYF